MDALTPDDMNALRRELALTLALLRAKRYEEVAGLLRCCEERAERLLAEAIRPGSLSRACIIARSLPPDRN